MDQNLNRGKPPPGEVLSEVDENGEENLQPEPSKSKGKAPIPQQMQPTVEEMKVETPHIPPIPKATKPNHKPQYSSPV